MNKMKNQKGITLIALIITIIVMLILVGVSVTVALNGGLFSTAKQATNKTQLELDKERLLEAAMGAIGKNGKVSFEYLDEHLPAGFTKTGEKTYTSEAGNTFAVSEYGSVTLVSEDESGAGGEEPTVTGWQQTENGEIKYVAEDGTVTTTLHVGDKINYIEGTTGQYSADATDGVGSERNNDNSPKSGTITAGGDLEWMVLGVNDDKQVELMSTKPTTETIAFDLYITSTNIENLLNDYADGVYGQGTGAEKARALALEDIYDIIEHKPETLSGYGDTYKIKYDSTKQAVIAINGEGNEYTISEGPDGPVTEYWGPGWVVGNTSAEGTNATTTEETVTNEPQGSVNLSSFSSNPIISAIKNCDSPNSVTLASTYYFAGTDAQSFYGALYIPWFYYEWGGDLGNTGPAIQYFGPNCVNYPAAGRASAAIFPVITLREDVIFGEPDSDNVRSVSVPQ